MPSCTHLRGLCLELDAIRSGVPQRYVDNAVMHQLGDSCAAQGQRVLQKAALNRNPHVTGDTAASSQLPSSNSEHSLACQHDRPLHRSNEPLRSGRVNCYHSFKRCSSRRTTTQRSAMSCETGATPVHAVVSCPPPCVAVLKKKPPVLPTSLPCAHSCPVLSQNALNWAGGDPYLPPTSTRMSARSHALRRTSRDRDGAQQLN